MVSAEVERWALFIAIPSMTVTLEDPVVIQVSISILKTRFNRFAQVAEARFSAGV